MSVSMGDVARHAGVSQRTVSNVVRGYVHVSPEMRSRVQRSLDALGYRPNVAARQLRSGRTGAITLAVPTLQERYFADLASAVIERAESAGLRVMIETTGGDHDRELTVLHGGGALLTDGVIMSALTLALDDHAAPRPKHPIVLVGDRAVKGPVDHVDIPNREAAEDAVGHLVALGRRRIALLGGGQSGGTETHDLRQLGYRAALDAAGIIFDPALLIPVEWTFEAGESAVDQMITSHARMPDAIFGMNDSVALGALRALQRAGVSVPATVALVGFDDTREARHALPSLTSIAPSLKAIATVALDLLVDQLEAGRERAAEHRHVPFTLVVRESTGVADGQQGPSARGH